MVASGDTIRGKTLSLLAMLTDEMEDQKLRPCVFVSEFFLWMSFLLSGKKFILKRCL